MDLIVTSPTELRALVRDEVRQAVAEAQPIRVAAPKHHPGIGWLSNRQAMKALGLSRPTLARYRAQGVLPYSKLGSNIYYRVADVQSVLEARSQKA